MAAAILLPYIKADSVEQNDNQAGGLGLNRSEVGSMSWVTFKNTVLEEV